MDFGRLCDRTGWQSCVRQPAAILILQRHAELQWDWHGLSRHSEALWLVDSLPSKRWQWHTICARCDISIAFVRRHKSRLPIESYFEILSANEAFSVTDIQNKADLPWAWDSFGNNTSPGLAFYKR
jgi:hypothetical protein